MKIFLLFNFKNLNKLTNYSPEILLIYNYFYRVEFNPSNHQPTYY